VRVELLVVPGCSSRRALEQTIHTLLDRLAPEAEFLVREVTTPEQAHRLRFPGSPTVRVDGRDLEPQADHTRHFGLG